MAEVSDVVRTRRVEVVDEQGRVRAVLGLIGQDESSTIWGLVVRDQNGRDRAWVIHDRELAEVALDFGGNTVASLTVSDTGEPSLFLGEEGDV